MGKRTGQFIGAYINGDIKRKLKQQAKAQDRSLAWLVEKILSEGVKHQEAEPLKKAA